MVQAQDGRHPPGPAQRVLEVLWQGTCWPRVGRRTPGKEVGMGERAIVVLVTATVLLLLLMGGYMVFMR